MLSAIKLWFNSKIPAVLRRGFLLAGGGMASNGEHTGLILGGAAGCRIIRQEDILIAAAMLQTGYCKPAAVRKKRTPAFAGTPKYILRCHMRHF